MPDLVCYTNNVAGLVDEAVSAGLFGWLSQDDQGDYQLGGDRTPLIDKHPEYIALLRVEDVELLGQMANIEVLGHYDEEEFIPLSSGALDKYNAIYDRSAVTKDFMGTEIEIIPPQRIGAFYG